MSTNRQWMYNRLKDGLLNIEFLNGLEEFIQFALTHPERMDGMNIRCPCSMRRCSNRKFLSVDDVRYHVMKNGFVPNYYRWTSHGECWDDQGNTSVQLSDTIMENNFRSEANGRYHEMVLEGFGLPPQIESMEEAPNAEAQKLYEMLQAANEELWPGCNKHTKLSTVARLMNMKLEHHFSVKCFDQIIEFVKEVLPEDNVLPDNFYKTKKLIEGLGLPVEKIDCCRNNCMIYWSGDGELQECKFCQLPRYKRTVNSLTKQVVQKPYKKMYYFPLTPRLQRLYASDATAPHMRWHAEHEYEEGVMHHPSDSPAWKHFNACYPLFGLEIRNVMLGLSTDGFQPFGQSGQQYSSWPIILTPYNLPPWLCMKSEYMFLTVIVSGPNNPKFKIDIFLQPLIEELKQLWNMGVETYDVDKKQNFLMRENYLKLKEQHSSQYVGSDHVEGDGGTINEDQLFITAAGGWQGSRVYGLGSAASSAFFQIGTGGTSTNVPSSQSPEWKKEIEAKFKEKYNSLQKLVEDQNQMIAQMLDEL
ncbi:uncharacterized protein LOC122724434 [Manihot esculenta]|uniref:uncharacterized protein LOC122724434 n=1 Tax=Manihot esculenta TaxID=3983 RepID=UPI001CC77325|nr:uncharacterized protein LOC122724434 [Manihot esculenta]